MGGAAGGPQHQTDQTARAKWVRSKVDQGGFKYGDLSDVDKKLYDYLPLAEGAVEQKRLEEVAKARPIEERKAKAQVISSRIRLAQARASGSGRRDTILTSPLGITAASGAAKTELGT
jgi:hypothetical protein